MNIEGDVISFVRANIVSSSCKNCDVAFVIKVNNNVVASTAFRAPSQYGVQADLSTLVQLKAGDVINIQACQNSGSDQVLNWTWSWRNCYD